MLSIGVDLGYGVVKVVGPAGRVRFPAVWAPYPTAIAGWGIGTAGARRRDRPGGEQCGRPAR